jgi:multimeric flavodoxin WrbA
MNILLAVGSPRKQGNTFKLAKEFEKQAIERGHRVDLLPLDKSIKPCKHCNKCTQDGDCALTDYLTPTLEKFSRYDAVIIASPTYFYHLTAQSKAFLDRLYSAPLVHRYLGAILISGSEFFEGGADLIVQSLKRTCDYSGPVWVGVVHKTSHDEILKVMPEDKANIKSLILSLEDNNKCNSCFIRG